MTSVKIATIIHKRHARTYICTRIHMHTHTYNARRWKLATSRRPTTSSKPRATSLDLSRASTYFHLGSWREAAGRCWKSRRVDVYGMGRVWEPFCGAPKTMERVQAGRPDGGGVVGWYKGTDVYGKEALSYLSFFFPPFPDRCSSSF